jgi:RNA polymerase sigma-70 factor (ECF subfamily)
VTTHHRDDEVVSRAKRGDTGAWRALYRTHAGRLLVWLSTRPTGDSAVGADDLAAEAWLVAAERIHTFTGTSEEFAGWLFGIARKLGGNVHRRGQRRDTWATDPHGIADLDDGAGHVVVSGPEPAYAAKEWVVRALACLPARERDVVGCLDVVGLDVETTARALGISPVAVRVAHHRGLRKLRRAADGPQPTSNARSRSR